MKNLIKKKVLFGPWPHYGLFLATIPLAFGVLSSEAGNKLATKPTTVHSAPKPFSEVPAAIQAKELDETLAQDEFFRFKNTDALADPYHRVSKEFKVPSELQPRVEFWFNIYTQFATHQHVIHHILYPWIVFDVVDTSPFMSTKGPKWLRIQRGRDEITKRISLIKKTLLSLSKKISFRKLSKIESKLYRQLKEIKGRRGKVFRAAAANLRSQMGQRDFFIGGLENSTKYMPTIESTFDKAKLPVELTRIPFVESSFNESAESKVGASGIWQIMPHMGKKLSIVSPSVDERNSPLKASQMAAKILKENYLLLKSWPLAVTAYNNGVGNIRRAMKRSKSSTLVELIRKYHKGSFKFASANFYSSFLAALHAERYHYEIFRDVILEKEPRIKKQPVRLVRRYRPRSLAKMVGIDVKTLLKYNMDLRHAAHKNLLLPKGYVVYLPPKRPQELKLTK